MKYVKKIILVFLTLPIGFSVWFVLTFLLYLSSGSRDKYQTILKNDNIICFVFPLVCFLFAFVVFYKLARRVS